MPRSDTPDALLCVCNYPSNTGYAWDFIESLYVQVAARLAPRGVRTIVAYPEITEPPRTLAGSPVEAVTLQASPGPLGQALEMARFVRRHRVKVVYYTDQPARSLTYLVLKAAGVRRIVVHDHSSGARSAPAGVRRMAKAALARAPGFGADVVVAVSDYVARRQVASGLTPQTRVVRVWNGIDLPPLPDEGDRPLHRALALPPERPVIACACRAAPEKGVPVLLAAFDLMMRTWPAARPRPILVYMGDGPDFARISNTREGLAAREDIILTGYRRDAGALIAGADVCAMPSVWQDALPLAVMQPMALGRAVVASAVGGIPEMIVDGETGLLVPASDPEALAAALRRLTEDPALRARLGGQARARVARLFAPGDQIDALTAVIAPGFS